MDTNILEVKNLSVKLGQEKIINNLSFNVKKGEFLTILGPNASGKTVLLKTLLDIFDYSGKIVWSKKAEVGYLPQGLTPLKVKNFPLLVEEFFNLKKNKFGDPMEFLKLVGITDKNILKDSIGSLSGGQFQRMLLAWVLSSKPNVLLFDEPTTGIDTNGEKTVYSLLHDLWKKEKMTIIMITHDLNIVSKYSTNVLCMSRDNVYHGKPKEILLPEILEEIYDAPVKYYQHYH